MKDPKDFALSEEELAEKDRGYLGLSMRDRKIIQQMIDQVDVDEILDTHKISLADLKCVMKKKSAIAYREYEERQLLKRYGYTRENVIRGLCDIAFSRMDDIVSWDNDNVVLRDSDFVSTAARNAVSEIQSNFYKGEKVVKIKMYDKLSALNALLKTFDGDQDNDDLDGDAIANLLNELNAAAKKVNEQICETKDATINPMETEPGPSITSME